MPNISSPARRPDSTESHCSRTSRHEIPAIPETWFAERPQQEPSFHCAGRHRFLQPVLSPNRRSQRHTCQSDAAFETSLPPTAWRTGDSIESALGESGPDGAFALFRRHLLSAVQFFADIHSSSKVVTALAASDLPVLARCPTGFPSSPLRERAEVRVFHCSRANDNHSGSQAPTPSPCPLPQGRGGKAGDSPYFRHQR